MLAYSKMGRKKGPRKTNTGAKARAKDRSTAVSQNVKVSIGASRKQPLRGRLGSRPSYTMPSFGGGGSASVSVTVPHSLPSFDQQMGYSIHTLSSNVDNLVRYLQQTQGAQPIPGPSSEALARSAVLSTATNGTQTEVPSGVATADFGTDPIAFATGPVQPTSVGSCLFARRARFQRLRTFSAAGRHNRIRVRFHVGAIATGRGRSSAFQRGSPIETASPEDTGTET